MSTAREQAVARRMVKAAEERAAERKHRREMARLDRDFERQMAVIEAFREREASKTWWDSIRSWFR